MKRIALDKVASAAKRSGIGHDVHLSEEIVSREGYVVAVRILTDKSVYNQLENLEGRMTRLKSGDTIAGVLGHRRALRGYAGRVPLCLTVGEHLQVLNLGGVLGRCSSYAADVGRPFEAQVLGAVLHFPHLGERVGEPAHIGLFALPPAGPIASSPPIIALLGTCMSAGKTQAACEIIHGLTRRGLRIAAGKVTGVALQRDVLHMRDYGAVEALSFLDAGIVTTRPETAADAARRVIAKLAAGGPDAIVLEFGDGILGEYGVGAVLAEADIVAQIRAIVMCANDPVGAVGAAELLRERFGLTADIFSGPVTDNEVGVSSIRAELSAPAANAITAPDELIALVHRKVFDEADAA